MRKNSWYLKLFGISMLNFFNRMKKMKVYRRYHFTFSKEDDEKERWRIGAKLNKINYHSVILKILRSLEELFSSFEGKGNRSPLSLSFSRPSFSTAKTRIYIYTKTTRIIGREFVSIFFCIKLENRIWN